MFGLTFTSDSDAGDGTIVYDQARCTSEINTRDDGFWLQTSVDGSMILDAETSKNVYTLDDTQDWDGYQEDDNMDDPLCAWDATMYSEWSGETVANS